MKSVEEKAKLAADLAPLMTKFDIWWDVSMGPIGAQMPEPSELDTLMKAQQANEGWQEPAPPFKVRGLAIDPTTYAANAPPDSIVVLIGDPTNTVVNEVPALKLRFDSTTNVVTEVLTPLGSIVLSAQALLLTPVPAGWAVFDGSGSVHNIAHSKDAAPFVGAAAGSPTAGKVLNE